MAKHVNLARMLVAGGGTGPLTLVGAAPGSLSFTQAGISNGDVVSYAIRTQDDSEVGHGTYNAGVLTRTTVLNSTNGDAAIDVSGAGEVFITLLAEDLSELAQTGQWADILGKPSTFPPSAHTHPTSEVTGLDAALDGKVSGTDFAIAWDGAEAKATLSYGVTNYGVTWPINVTGQAAHAYSSTYAYSSSRFNEELPSYYTDIPARLGYTPASTDVVTTSANGLMIAADKTKLDGVQAGAQVNPGVATTSADGLMSSGDKTKLNGVATGATANATNAQLRDRATHTGAQAISTVTGLQTALDAKAGLATATTSVNGLMSSADKTKLDSITAAATSVGNSLISAVSAAAARTALGFTTVGSALATAASEAAARTALGFTTIGSTLATAASEVAARTAIGAQHRVDAIRNFEFGSIAAGTGPLVLDMHVGTGAVDYNARIVRNTGANGALQIVNTGTGGIGIGTDGQALVGIAYDGRITCTPSGGGSPGYAVTNSQQNFNDFTWSNPNLTLVISGTPVTWTPTISDVKHKENIQNSPVRALDLVDAFRYVSFDWKPDFIMQGHMPIGLIAQEVQLVAPNLVNGEDTLNINSTEMIYTLGKAVQELSAEVAALKAQLAQ